MSFVCDFHVHLYPCYELDSAFSSAHRNLSSFGAETRAICLTERFDCHFFKRLTDRDPTLKLGHWNVETTADTSCLRLTKGEQELFVFAGRQIAASERIELLTLFADTDISDRIPFERARKLAVAQGALPVLNWALGKWMFARKAIVEDILKSVSPSEFAICDTSLRPTLWPEPKLMQLAQKRGIPLLVGSDPLPFAGEEELIGTYALKSVLHFDPAEPLASIRRIFQNGSELQIVGTRSGTASTVRRNLTLLRQR